MPTDVAWARRRQRPAARVSLVTLAALLAGASPAAAQPPERDAFFGDLHLHTGWSFDAAASGTATTPDDAYRYARGETVRYLGGDVRRRVPLDFLAVTDHAEYLGVAPQAADPNGPFAATDWPRRLEAVSADTLAYMRLFAASAFRGAEPPIAELTTPPLIASNWQLAIAAAERHYEPGRFTTFVGFEWSPMQNGAHLHRNAIFAGPDYPERPFSALDSRRPEDLWSYVEALRARGIDSLLIPHNSNLSQGLMFGLLDSAGEPLTRAYAERRVLNERLVEITQNKGTSETRPVVSPQDPHAGFELLDVAAERGADPAGGYVRPALARGLAIEAALGVNPFRFGLIGSTDSHAGVSSTEEDNFAGALGRADDMDDPEAVLTTVNPIAGTPATVFSAGGLTGVWAEANTRESLFAALQRREVFATSGTRLRVRVFAGFDFAADLLERADWIDAAYARGVPMGAELTAPSARRRPLQLAIQAVKDPAGANLDRVQVVKIWLEGGAPRETVLDALEAGGPETGAVELAGVWTDATFDAQVPAIYYVRVLEMPTARWSTLLAVRNGLPVPDGVPATIQERAWSSPIFYAP